MNAIRGQMLRTVLTVLIIAFGIMALVGILTSIDALKGSINSSFSSMGANSFTIRNSGMNIHMGGRAKKAKKHSKITYYQAIEFSRRFKYPSRVSVSTMADQVGTIRYENIKSNPNITVMGVDPDYLDVSGYTLSAGRNFSVHDLEEGLHVCILGKELVDKLFTTKTGEINPIDKIVSVGPAKYRVIGILGEKGSSMGFGGDKVCLIPLTNAKQDYGNDYATYSITVKLNQVTDMEPATGEATSMMRNVRKDQIGEEDSFEITQSDSLAGILIDSMSTVTLSATIIGIITLLGASIGLMNIMLVSVTERTREIGIRKSLGATRQTIRKQFLTEAIVICQLGGLTGIILGVLIGNLISVAVGGAFIIPWDWIILGVSVCFLVGLAAGIYPAIKASNLDPIEALRYE